MEDLIIRKLDVFFAKFPSIEYKKDSVIITPGVDPTGIFYIESGIVRKYWISEEGSELTLNFYKPKTFIPMSHAVGKLPIIHFYEAMTDVLAKKAPKEEVLDYIKHEPEVLYNLLQRVFVGMEGLWMQLKNITKGDSYTKLASSLFILAKRFGEKKDHGIVINLKMSGQDLSHYAGMSRETTSREFQKFKKQHLADFEKGTITVFNLKKLEELLIV